MGKGSEQHEEPIRWLEKRYGEGEDKKLIDIYYGELSKKHGEPHTADYVGDHKECNAYLEVIYGTKDDGEEWREVLGKVVAYAYEVKQKNSPKEIWIITPVKLERSRDDDYHRTRYRKIIEVARNVIDSEIGEKVKLYEYDPEIDEDQDRLIEVL